MPYIYRMYTHYSDSDVIVNHETTLLYIIRLSRDDILT